MDSLSARAAAEILWRARLESRLIEALPQHCFPRQLEDGYDIQDRMTELCGERVVGWKIAATSIAGQRHIGVTEPLGGRLYERFLHADGAVLRADNLHMRVAEAEFAFRLETDLPRRRRPYTVAEALEATSGLHVAIEVPDSRFRAFDAAGAPQLVADDACAGFFVLGGAAADWRAVDLARHPVGMIKDGLRAAEGSGANVLGDPRLALAWIANDRAKRGASLKAGDIVTTGTCTPPLAIAPGISVVADFGDLGRVGVRFAPP